VWQVNVVKHYGGAFRNKIKIIQRAQFATLGQAEMWASQFHGKYGINILALGNHYDHPVELAHQEEVLMDEFERTVADYWGEDYDPKRLDYLADKMSDIEEKKWQSHDDVPF
jgi:uncharacterized coiled-coil protein SlyX